VSWLTPDVVEAVAKHMNTDHEEDLLVMVAGSAPGAISAQVIGLDKAALHVRIVEPGCDREVALPWPGPLTRRSDIRTYVVQMHRRALGEK